MSASVEGLSLVTVIALIRKEIAETRTEGLPGEDGKQGAKGERGAKGDTGPQGKVGPKGGDGKQGKAGKDGKDGKDGNDGVDGVGIQDIQQDIDGAIVVTMTDGESYTIEMPFGENSTEVHYKVSGGGGGTVDLSDYVPRPDINDPTIQDKWLVYREPSNSDQGEWAIATTDLIETNPNVTFRDNKGRFARWPEEMEGLDNQLKVNRWFYDKVVDLQNSLKDFGFTEVPNGSRTLKHDPNLLSHGGPVSSDDLLILHTAIADCIGDPCQKLVFVAPEGKEIISHYEETQQEAIFKIVQINSEGEMIRQTMRGKDGGVMNGDVYSIECDEVYGDDLLDGVECEILVRTSAAITAEWVENNFVQKHKDGGDYMEGPLHIKNQAGVDSRQASRLVALNVFSGSQNSSLQLGTSNTKIYVGHNDTAFNTPLKLSEIQDRGAGITVTGTIKFADQDILMDIAPAAGTTQSIDIFNGVGSSDDHTILKVDLHGATFKKAIEFESGPSSNKEIIFRLDSNRGIRARNLNMDDTNISNLADPTNDEHAVNLRTVDSLIDNLEDRITDRLDTLITDNSSGEMKFAIQQMPSDNGDFQCMTTNGASSTYDPMQTREIWAHNQNLSGYAFNWDKVEPNMYFYMAGPNDSLARFRVVAAPIDQGRWTNIKVNDPEIYPADQKWEVGDVWNILFRTFTGDSVDLDDYVKKTGDTMTGPLDAQLHTDYIKFSGDSKRIVEDGSVRIEFDKRVIIKKGTTVPGGGFELKGRTTEGINEKLLQVYHNNTGGLDAVNYYGKQEGDTNLATVGYVDSKVGGGVTHTMLGKGGWGRSLDELATDKFIGFDYNGTTYNNLNQYTMGIAVAQRFGNEYTEGLEWKEGAYVEVFDNSGNLIFCEEINRVEHDAKGYMRLHWEWMPTMYIATSLKYGDQLMLKITGLTGDVRQSRNSPMAPPLDDPDIGE